MFVLPRPSAALRPAELERFKADEGFFKSVRYTLEESMNVSNSTIRCAVATREMSDGSVSVVDALVHAAWERDAKRVPRGVQKEHGREARGEAGHC